MKNYRKNILNNKLSNIFYIYLYIFICLLSKVTSADKAGNTFTVVTPQNVADQIGLFDSQTNGVPYNIGKFGEVPFGKTVLAMIFFQQQRDGFNYWCDYEKTVTPRELESDNTIYKEYLPMFIVDQGGCSYSSKALNVQKKGGKAMLIVDDDNDLSNNDRYNVLDVKGNLIKIPSIVIPRAYGDIFRKYLIEQKQNNPYSLEGKIIINIKFAAYNPDGTVKLELFMSSDDLNAINFFKDFKKYKKALGNKLVFNPVYKYHNFNYKDSAIDNSATLSNKPCFSKGTINFCTSNNTDLQITNPRLVLLENLKQTCIFIKYGLDFYWSYMEEFASRCADLTNPKFDRMCSEEVSGKLEINTTEHNSILECMQNLIVYDSKVNEDYDLFNYRKIYEYPMIALNGIKFKGTWLPRTIFNSICTSFIDDQEICGSVKMGNSYLNSFSFSTRLIVFISLLFSFFTLILICCYRRFINRSLEQSIIEKIQSQTISSIGKYHSAKMEKNQLSEEE